MQVLGGVEVQIQSASLADANEQIPKIRAKIRKELLRTIDESGAVRERLRRRL